MTTTSPKRRHRRVQLHAMSAGARYLAAFRTSKGAVAAIGLSLMFLIAALAPVLFPGGYDEQTGNTFAGVSLQHPFGTDELGRDIATRAVYGLRADLSLILVAVPISMAIGTVLGLVGAVSRVAGELIQRVLDLIMGFPSLLLGICLVIVFSPGPLALMLAIGILGLPTFGRIARAALLSEQERDYVLAARVLGVRRPTIMLRHILPNAVDPIILQLSASMVGGIFLESSLSVVGLGIQPPSPSLGAMLNTGIRYLSTHPAYVLGPIVVLLALALFFVLLSDALNEAVAR